LIAKIRKVFLLLMLFSLLCVGYYGYSFYKFTNGIQENGSSGSDKTASAKEIPMWGGTERVNILLMGVDSRNSRQGDLPRSDSMLLVSIDPKQKTYDIFSIMRDTYVRIPEYGRSRINAALGIGGPEVAMETVSRFTGVPVNYYVITDFEGFKSLIDAVGGVEIDVEKNMRYRDPTDKGLYDINLKKGLQRLDGDKALQYVRFRHDAMSDYTRTERQRKLLSALAAQLKSSKTILQLPEILESIQPYIKTNLSTVDMLKLSVLGLSLHGSTPGGYQLPPPGLFQEENRGGSVLVPYVEGVQQFVQEKLQPKQQ